MSRVLWLSNETPNRHGQGGQRRQYFQIASAAAEGHLVTVGTLSGPQSHGTVSELAEVVRLPAPGRRRLGLALGGRRQARLFARSFDRIVVAHSESWLTWRDYLTGCHTPVFVDMHNVLSSWYSSLGNEGEARRWSRIEEEILHRASAVAVCSARERHALGAGGEKTEVVGHGVSPEEWPFVPRPAARPVIKLFGNWGWAPNGEGLRWFLDEVWPSLRDHTQMRCEVAGDGWNASQSPAGDGVHFAGRVPDIAQFLSDAWIVALPVKHGVGAPVKYAEALASGVPLLATADAVPVHPEAAAHLSDDPRAWVAWVHGFLDDPASARINAERSREHTLTQHTWGAVTQPLLRWLNDT